jgi:hypothetical protein
LLSNKQEPLVTPVSLSPRLLLRCVSGGGSIKFSLWAMPYSYFGNFLNRLRRRIILSLYGQMLYNYRENVPEITT